MTDREKLTAVRTKIEWLMSNHDSALDYEAALEDVRNFIDSMQEEPKKCMYSKDNYTEEDRKILCEGCEEKCEYAQKEEPVSEELEEAANNALNNVLNAHEIVNVRSCLEMFKYGAKWQKEKEYTCYEEAFEDGAKWKKEQMMAKAIDGDITFDYYGDDDKTYGCIAHDSFCLEDKGLKDRDKVKLVIIKGDSQ